MILQALAAAEPDVAACIAATEGELALLRKRHPESHPAIAIAMLRLAEARAASGQGDAAQELLASASAALRATQVPASPWLARAESLSGRLLPPE